MSIQPSTRPRRVWGGLIVVFSIVLVGCFCAWYFYPSDTVTPCKANMARIAKALLNYEDKYKSLPPAYTADEHGNSMHSWRVLVLPFLGEEELYEAYDLNEPWNGPNNRKLASRIPTVYFCPGDRSRAPTDTSYVAVVGAETNWPGATAMTTAQLYKGKSNSVAIVETAQSGIHWMEPRNIPWSPHIQRDLISRCMTSHKGGSNVAMFDGIVTFVSKDVDEYSLANALTRGSFSFFEDTKNAIGDFRTVVPASSLVKTDIVPHTAGRITTGRNYVYGATVQLAWDQWRDELGVEEIHLQGADEFCRHMNERRFPTAALSPKDYVALAGQNLASRVASELKSKFPNRSLDIPNVDDPELALFAYLSKNLPFAVKFGILDRPLTFSSTAATFKVASFGLESVAEGDDVTFKEQVRILDYRNTNDFVVQLNTESDTIVLAKVQPLATMQQTLEAVKRRIQARASIYRRPQLEFGDAFVVPMLAISVDQQFNEMIGKKETTTGVEFVDSRQVIQFLLSESGARIDMSYSGVMLDDDEPEPPDTNPRNIVFDKPFLIYLKERRATEPYFAMWVENLEVLAKFKE